MEESELVSELGRGTIWVLCSVVARNRSSGVTAASTDIPRVNHSIYISFERLKGFVTVGAQCRHEYKHLRIIRKNPSGV